MNVKTMGPTEDNVKVGIVAFNFETGVNRQFLADFYALITHFPDF